MNGVNPAFARPAHCACALLSLLAVSVIVFAITGVLPGDAAQEQLGQEATPESLAALRATMGLDVPAPQRYLHWLGGLVTGNLGVSVGHATARGRADRQPAAELVAASGCDGILLGPDCADARDRGGGMARLLVRPRRLHQCAVAIVSVPEFLVATLAVLVFAVQLRWLPALSYVSDIESLGQLLRAFAMPVLTLSCVIVAQMMRMTRAAVIDQLEAPYIEMVRLKGASPLRTVLAHALPNAVGPIANAVALSLSYLLGGVIIVETIFNYPGIAKLMVDGVSQRDMPLGANLCDAVLHRLPHPRDDCRTCAAFSPIRGYGIAKEFYRCHRSRRRPHSPVPHGRPGSRVSRTSAVSGWIGLAIVAFWALAAIFGPALLSRTGAAGGGAVFAPISAAHWLGTDYLGARHAGAGDRGLRATRSALPSSRRCLRAGPARCSRCSLRRATAGPTPHSVAPWIP